MAGRRLIARNAEGYRVGESHHNAKIPDEVVRKLRDLHENEGLTLRDLAERFRMRYWTVVRICCYQVRAQVPDPERSSYERDDGAGRRRFAQGCSGDE